jgi:hypothetical protein
MRAMRTPHSLLAKQITTIPEGGILTEKEILLTRGASGAASLVWTFPIH